MKRLFIFFALMCMGMGMSAQTTVAEWAAAVNKFGAGLPQEKVYLHTDNTAYFLGDTIFYRAYLMRSDRQVASAISGVLYVELLNADGYLIERQQVKMRQGMGTGTIVLDTATCLYAGYYELRAYTRWQLNWGQTTYPHSKYSEKWFFKRSMARDYYRDYEKLYSRVLPVYDYPLAPGDYTRDMTERATTRYFKSDDERDPEIKLYPEGGNLLAGAPCRMAFDASDGFGRHLRGTLRITDGHGAVVAEGKTLHRGRGVVTFTANAGNSYRCAFVTDEKTYKVRLPQLHATGATLKCDATAGMLDIEVQPVGDAAGEQLGMTIMNGGVVARTIVLSAEGLKHSLPLAELPMGVLDVTLFNSEGRVYADRLVFNPGTDEAIKRHTIDIDGVTGPTDAYKPVTLTLRSGAGKGGIVSVAVMDAATYDNIYDNGTMLTEMLLSSEIRGFVEDPAYYFEARDDEHRTALDLLMMVQGWRRFDWRVMSMPKEFTLTHPYETQSPIMSGKVHRYDPQLPADLFREMQEEEIERYMGTSTDELAGVTHSEGEGVTYNSLDELREFEEQAIAMSKRSQEKEKAEERFEENYGGLKREVMVHAEFAQPGSEVLVGDMVTEKACFKIQSPIFEGECYFNLAASDTTKWSKKKEHQWVQVNSDDERKREFAEFYVKLDHPYPRFTHPYNFYQTAPAENRAPNSLDLAPGTFDDRQLSQVTVRVRRNGRRAFDRNAPSFVLSAYDALNYAIDAGLCTGQYLGSSRFANDVARAYIGDMGVERRYDLFVRLDHKNSSSNMSEAERNAYNDLANIGEVRVYTDFAPRRVGDSRWAGSDQPMVVVDLLRWPNEARNYTYRDRRIKLQGFSFCEDFYNPDYSKMPLPKQPDFRRTLYWNPTLRLDEQGEARITFYRNSRKGEIVVTANGFSNDGKVLSY